MGNLAFYAGFTVAAGLLFVALLGLLGRRTQVAGIAICAVMATLGLLLSTVGIGGVKIDVVEVSPPAKVQAQ